MAEPLHIGTAEIDITPPVGTLLCGSLEPRPATGTQDPLLIKAIVLASDNVRLAYAIFDLAMLGRRVGDEAITLASDQTGIPADHIVWACSHSHTSPYTDDWFPIGQSDPVNREWLATLPERFARCVAAADAARTPATMSRLRAYQCGLSHNRRLRFKDGREINTWLLGGDDSDVQCVGAAGPIDPEVGILAFDDPRGNLLAVMFSFALHANTNFGRLFSGDYPAVVASRLRERYGPQVSTLFLPGACGNLNGTGHTYRQVGDALANSIIEQLERRKPSGSAVPLGVVKRDVVVPYRDFAVDQEKRIKASQWSPESQEHFRSNLEFMRKRGQREARTILQAWRIGDVGFVSLPGELFVEWGLKLKQDSPFAWTWPVELGGDYVGYLVTRRAWEAGGYESLISTVAPADVGGVEKMLDAALQMLRELWRTAPT